MEGGNIDSMAIAAANGGHLRNTGSFIASYTFSSANSPAAELRLPPNNRRFDGSVDVRADSSWTNLNTLSQRSASTRRAQYVDIPDR